MAFKLEPVERTHEGAVEWANIVLPANDQLPADDGRTVAMQIEFPNYQSPQTQKYTHEKLLKALGQKEIIATKAVDVSTGKAVGVIMSMERPQEKKDPGAVELGRARYDSDEDHAFAEAMMDASQRMFTEWQWEDDGKVMVLRSLAVLKEYQGRGVGKMLIKSVLDRADAGGMKTMVMTVEGASHVYTKMGFTHRHTKQAPISGKWPGRHIPSAMVMFREPDASRLN